MVDGLVVEGADNESERRRGRQREKGRARKRVLYAFDSFTSACCSAEPLEKKKVGRILASDSGGFPCSCEVASKNAGNFDSRRPTPKHDALPAEFLSLSLGLFPSVLSLQYHQYDLINVLIRQSRSEQIYLRPLTEIPIGPPANSLLLFDQN